MGMDLRRGRIPRSGRGKGGGAREGKGEGGGAISAQRGARAWGVAGTTGPRVPPLTPPRRSIRKRFRGDWNWGES